MSIILFLLVLFVLVLVHEWGHFVVAKKTGMRVDEFGIGFPPKLFGIKRGETEYTFNLLPIGGFVRIFGENPEASTSEHTPEDISRAFYMRPKWAQALVLVAGITMNIIFAWFLFSLAYMIGVPTAVEESAASEEAVLLVSGTLPRAPADGVIPVGATILKIASGDATLEQPTPTSFSSFISEHAPEDVVITYRDGKEEVTVTVTPKKGFVADDENKYIVGTSLSLIETVRVNPLTALAKGGSITADGLVGITVGLGTLLKNAVVGEADFSSIAGPVGIVGMVGDAASFGFTALLLFAATISLNLAIINILPFPALDGGRLLFVGIEAATGKPIPHRVAGYLNLAGFALLMLLMVVVTFNDINRLF